MEERMAEQLDMPVYARIALDLAGKIASGELDPGSRLYGRSLLAGQYHVSPETVRRSIQLLEDASIVETRPGSGIVVLSKEQALAYVERHRVMTGIRAIRAEIRQLLGQKAAIEEQISILIERLEEQADRLQNVRPIYPGEIPVPAGSPLLGKTITESKFWQNTGATIVAIQRGAAIIRSPGPDAVFTAGDILFITGEAGVEPRTEEFLSKG